MAIAKKDKSKITKAVISKALNENYGLVKAIESGEEGALQHFFNELLARPHLMKTGKDMDRKLLMIGADGDFERTVSFEQYMRIRSYEYNRTLEDDMDRGIPFLDYEASFSNIPTAKYNGSGDAEGLFIETLASSHMRKRMWILAGIGAFDEYGLEQMIPLALDIKMSKDLQTVETMPKYVKDQDSPKSAYKAADSNSTDNQMNCKSEEFHEFLNTPMCAKISTTAKNVRIPKSTLLSLDTVEGKMLYAFCVAGGGGYLFKAWQRAVAGLEGIDAIVVPEKNLSLCKIQQGHLEGALSFARDYKEELENVDVVSKVKTLLTDYESLGDKTQALLCDLSGKPFGKDPTTPRMKKAFSATNARDQLKNGMVVLLEQYFGV